MLDSFGRPFWIHLRVHFGDIILYCRVRFKVIPVFISGPFPRSIWIHFLSIFYVDPRVVFGFVFASIVISFPRPFGHIAATSLIPFRVCFVFLFNGL